jgi:hypothetical protein
MLMDDLVKIGLVPTDGLMPVVEGVMPSGSITL